MNYHNLLAHRTQRMHVNAIREILKVASQPGMISLAGGIPAPESFPLELITELNGRVMATYAEEALQYGPTEGFYPLREALAVRLAEKDLALTPQDLLITSGSQGALDAIGKDMSHVVIHLCLCVLHHLLCKQHDCSFSMWWYLQ